MEHHPHLLSLDGYSRSSSMGGNSSRSEISSCIDRRSTSSRRSSSSSGGGDGGVGGSKRRDSSNSDRYSARRASAWADRGRRDTGSRRKRRGVQQTRLSAALLSSIVLAVVSTAKFVVALVDPSEVAALQRFQEAVGSPPALQSWSWGDPCGGPWVGVNCSSDAQHVVGLNLDGLGLKGPLDTSLSDLPFLTSLSLGKNNLSGGIPDEFSKLQKLETLDLHLNPLTSVIPTSLEQITTLKYLDLSSCQLTGPPRWGNWPSIEHISYGNNFLLGTLPTVFLPMTALTSLDVRGNVLMDTIPTSIATLTALEMLSLGFNRLKGSLPAELSRITGLQYLVVAYNLLSGELPPALGGLAQLSFLDLRGNDFQGAIPASYSSIRFVRVTGNDNLAPTAAATVAPGTAPAPSVPISPPLPPSTPSPAPEPAPSPLSSPAPQTPPPPFLRSSPRPPPRLLLSSPPPAFKPPPVLVPDPSPPPSPSPTLAPLPAPAPSPQRPNPSPPGGKLPPPSAPPPPRKAGLPPGGDGGEGVLPPPSPLLVPSPPGCPPCAPGLLSRLDGPTPAGCTCVAPLLFQLHMSMAYKDYTPMKEASLVTQLATGLGVTIPQVRVLSTRKGSVIAACALLPALPATTLSVEEANRVADVLRGANGDRLVLEGFGKVSVESITAPTEFQAPAPGQNDTPPATGTNSSSTNSNATTSSSSTGSSSGGLSTAAIIGISVAAAVVAAAVVLVLLWCCCWSRRGSDVFQDIEKTPDDRLLAAGKGRQARRADTTSSMSSSGAASGISRRAMMLVAGGAHRFSLAELQMATDNWDPELKIRDDFLGEVFHGHLSDGTELAIRKVDPAIVEGQSDEDFTAVAANMARLEHANLVRLVGFSVDFGERLLVFDTHSALATSLFKALQSDDPHVFSMLTWEARIEIAVGIARALEYLHEQCLPPIIHRSISSKAILLDDQLNPRVADAGLAVLNPMGTDNKSLSDQLTGGFAYNAPEYAMSGIYTAKSDVYSYGVVLLELLTGRKPVDSTKAHDNSLVRWAAPLLHKTAELEHMLDSRIPPDSRPSPQNLARFAEVITRCIQPEPEFRPTMSKVVQDLCSRVQKVKSTSFSGRLYFSGKDQ